ncbi:MAG: ABC transporter ATP-binding protein/permease [Prevotellaceae bacterium]|jgi:ABC-type multidrug transport system fused ATPase/permease subunit|nr:ABC transporter ATP-binding protein/permease [Prevotellaceae bacterium]
MLSIIKILPKQYRRQGVGVALSALLRAILNFAGLAAIIPVLILILDPQAIGSNSAFGKFRLWAGVGGDTTFAFVICIIILGFIIVKNVANVMLGTFQINYVNKIYRLFSKRLYIRYFQKGLLFIKTNHSTGLSHKINGVCFTFAQNVLSRFFTMIGEGALLFFMWLALLFYSWKAALLSLVCFMPIMCLYLWMIRHRLAHCGKAENELRRKQVRIVTETFKGYAEIQINNAFPLLLKRFGEGLGDITRFRKYIDLVLRIPGAAMECLVAGGMILLVLLSRGDSSAKVAFSMYALALLRMLPAIRTLIIGWTQIKNNLYTVDIVKEAVVQNNTPAGAFAEPVSFNDKIELKNVTFAFPDTGEPIIRNLSISIAKGEHVGIQGISGVGKSTLFNLLLGFYTPQQGSITIDGRELNATTCELWQRMISYVPQDIFIMDATLAENIAFGNENIDREKLAEALNQADLMDFVQTLPHGIDTGIGEGGCRLSGGQRQRIGIARAFYKQAEVIFFDEVTSALDQGSEEKISRAINKQADGKKNTTLVIISHRPSTLRFCDRVIKLE